MLKQDCIYSKHTSSSMLSLYCEQVSTLMIKFGSNTLFFLDHLKMALVFKKKKKIHFLYIKQQQK